MVTRRTKTGKVLKSASAREDQKKVRALTADAIPAGWPLIENYVPCSYEVEIVAWNTRKDCGNIEKVLCDGMTGVAYDDDRRIVKLTVEKRKDRGGERYEVVVRPAEPLETPKKAVGKTNGNFVGTNLAILNQGCPSPGTIVQTTGYMRPVESLKSGDTITFAERDALLKHYTKVSKEADALPQIKVRANKR
jgi:hypothetical protein